MTLARTTAGSRCAPSALTCGKPTSRESAPAPMPTAYAAGSVHPGIVAASVSRTARRPSGVLQSTTSLMATTLARQAGPGMTEPAGRRARRARSVGSELDAEAAGRAGPLAARAQAAQALDQHRVGLERGRAVDQGVEHLVVARRAHVEELTDRLLLGPGVLPPLPLEGDDLAVALTQLGGGAGVILLVCGVHSRPSTLRCLACRGNYTDRITRLSFRSARLAGNLSGARHTRHTGRHQHHQPAAHRPPPARPSGPRRRQAMVSRMPVMSSSEVLGLTIAKRVSVSPSCEVGTTNANSSASSRSDHCWYSRGVHPSRRNTMTDRSGSRTTSR